MALLVFLFLEYWKARRLWVFVFPLDLGSYDVSA
jgi:hypothetical protein